MGSASRSRSYGFTHGSTLPQAESPASIVNAIVNAGRTRKTRTKIGVDMMSLLSGILRDFPGANREPCLRKDRRNGLSEKNGQSEMALEVMHGLLLTQQVGVEQVIAEIEVQGNRIRQQETHTGAEVHGEAIVAAERR